MWEAPTWPLLTSLRTRSCRCLLLKTRTTSLIHSFSVSQLCLSHSYVVRFFFQHTTLLHWADVFWLQSCGALFCVSCAIKEHSCRHPFTIIGLWKLCEDAEKSIHTFVLQSNHTFCKLRSRKIEFHPRMTDHTGDIVSQDCLSEDQLVLLAQSGAGLPVALTQLSSKGRPKTLEHARACTNAN